MSKNATLSQEGTDDSIDTLDARDARALTEYLTVLEDQGRVRDAPGLFEVVSGSGEAYLVDTDAGRCECWDDRRDDRPRCKHRRRVAFATGERAIPAWVARDELDPDLGRHVDGGPRVAATDGGIVEADDDGEVLEEPADDVDDGRPDDCDCAPFLAEEGLPCWPCYREGHEAPNPAALEGDGE